MSLQNRRYRAATVKEAVRSVIALQIRQLRQKSGKSQVALASEASTSQSAIARLEDPDYGRVSVTTLLKLATALDVALLVKFVPFSKFIKEYADLSPGALSVPTFDEEKKESEEQVASVPTEASNLQYAAGPFKWQRMSGTSQVIGTEVGFIKGTFGSNMPARVETPSVVFGVRDRLIRQEIAQTA